MRATERRGGHRRRPGDRPRDRLALGDMGFALVVNYRSDDDAAASRPAARPSSVGRRAQWRSGPTSADLEQGHRLVDESLAAFGRVDLWVNNAGRRPRDSGWICWKRTPESWDRVLNTNLRGPFFLTQAVARAMIELIAAGTVTAAADRVHHIDLEHVRQRVTARILRVQGRTEHGRSALRGSAGRHGIRVYEIRPGLIETEMTRPVREAYDQKIAAGFTPIPRWGTPDDVGRAVAAIAAGAISVFHRARSSRSMAD